MRARQLHAREKLVWTALGALVLYLFSRALLLAIKVQEKFKMRATLREWFDLALALVLSGFILGGTLAVLVVPLLVLVSPCLVAAWALLIWAAG